jgi:hypothetical protein
MRGCASRCRAHAKLPGAAAEPGLAGQPAFGRVVTERLENLELVFKSRIEELDAF